ncbi:nucleotidyltransferase domain-containing protein [Bacteroides sp.]|uniref:DNA polymerase beta superfamily protein n=1 Tax=Bacteroides sp. TaxID=29523 RepID=UPI00260D773C|nr:nucleotidyltransferase domain-containing protein [Bacteroides sp.]MDD3040557.1 nucleotidyltransferase domain-containing protein [Bacteroides sp.]
MVGLIFSAMIGSRACGYNRDNSDYDLRVIYAANLDDIFGLDRLKETDVTRTDQFEIESHEIKKFIGMLLKSNPNSIETLFSPVQIHHDDRYWDELRELGKACITQDMIPAYEGLSHTLIKRANASTGAEKVKTINVLHRNLLTCLYMVMYGEIEINLRKLKDAFGHSIADDWEQTAYELLDEIKTFPTKIPAHISDETRKRANDLLLTIRYDSL